MKACTTNELRGRVERCTGDKSDALAELCRRADTAQDLLTALQRVLLYCNLHVSGHNGRMDRAIQDAHTVIAKAEK